MKYTLSNTTIAKIRNLSSPQDNKEYQTPEGIYLYKKGDTSPDNGMTVIVSKKGHRFLLHGLEIVEDNVESVVIWLRGQSNAFAPHTVYETYNPYKDVSEYKLIWNETTKAFEPLQLGVNNLGRTEATVRAGAESSLLANLSAAYPGRKVYLVKTATNSSHIYKNEEQDWNADSQSELLDKSIATMQEALSTIAGPVKIIEVFIQGEADAWAERTAAQYLTDRQAIHNKSKAAIGPFQVIECQLSIRQGNVRRENVEQVREGKLLFVAANPEAQLLDMDNEDLRDPYHYEPSGTARIGEQAVYMATGHQPIRSTPQPVPPNHIEFDPSGGIEEIGPNLYYGAPAMVAKAPMPFGRFAVKNLPNGSIGLYDAAAGGSVIFLIKTDGGKAVFSAYNQVEFTNSNPADWYGLLVSADGIYYQYSLDGKDWKTIGKSPSNYKGNVWPTAGNAWPVTFEASLIKV